MLLALLAALALAAPAAPAEGAAALTPAAPRTLELRIETPPELAARGREILALPPDFLTSAFEMTGLDDPGGPVTVALAPEDSQTARAAPTWVVGFARPDLDLVVLFPARAPRYPDEGLPEVLRHELAHVLLHRAAKGHPLPRVFDEGLALLVSRRASMEDRVRSTWAAMGSGSFSLAEVDALFYGDPSEVSRAYALSGGFVRELVGRYGPLFPRRLLQAVARGVPFESAFREATGAPLALEEARFARVHRSIARWLPVVTGGGVLWGAMALLLVLARVARKKRDAAIRQRWELEEVMRERTRELERQAEEERARSL